jgi:hypothetical protein
MKPIVVFGPLLAVALLLSGCGGQPATDAQDDANEALSGAVLKADEPAQTGNDCEAACTNYVNKCLTLVPGADETLFQQGRDSCMDVCVEWTSEKADCIATAASCEPMTDVCGL